MAVGQADQHHHQLDRGVEAASAAGADSMIGTSLGPCKIIEQLGAGGMGEVYLGEGQAMIFSAT